MLFYNEIKQQLTVVAIMAGGISSKDKESQSSQQPLEGAIRFDEAASLIFRVPVKELCESESEYR